MLLVLGALAAGCGPAGAPRPAAVPAGLPWFRDVTREAGLDFVVVWPDGSEETFVGGPGDRAVVLRRGAGLRDTNGRTS